MPLREASTRLLSRVDIELIRETEWNTPDEPCDSVFPGGGRLTRCTEDARSFLEEPYETPRAPGAFPLIRCSRDPSRLHARS